MINDRTEVSIYSTIPYTEKSRSLAERWLNYSQMKAMKIQFFLVKENGEIHFVN